MAATKSVTGLKAGRHIPGGLVHLGGGRGAGVGPIVAGRQVLDGDVPDQYPFHSDTVARDL